jgi:hypothetical protein
MIWSHARDQALTLVGDPDLACDRLIHHLKFRTVDILPSKGALKNVDEILRRFEFDHAVGSPCKVTTNGRISVHDQANH